MTLRKREDNGSRNTKHWIAFSGELALKNAMDLSKTLHDGGGSEGKMPTRRPRRRGKDSIKFGS